MNRKLIFALFGLVLAGLLTACTGTVPPVTAEPTVVIPTEVPTETEEPTPTEVPTATPTERTSPTPTPTLVPLAEWAMANGFQRREAGEGVEYYERVDGRVSFWVQSYDDLREVAVRIPNNASQAERDEALNTWVRNISELLTPAIAEAAAEATPNLEPQEMTEEGGPIDTTLVDGYEVGYLAWRMGSDTAFSVVAWPADPAAYPDDYLLLLDSIETVVEGDCLAVTPQTGDSTGEEFGSWLGRYLDEIWVEALGEERPPQEYYAEIFVLPPFPDQPGCVVGLYQDPASGEGFLIYETEDGVVKVPFTPPSP